MTNLPTDAFRYAENVLKNFPVKQPPRNYRLF